MTKIPAVIAVFGGLLVIGVAGSTGYPSAEITNGVIHAKIYLPDARTGFYRGTRFDWSGVVFSLEAGGHHYYGPWFNKTDPSVHDFVYRGEDIVAGPCSAISGPVDEFAPLGYGDAKPGSTFVKIGIGALRKLNNAEYDNYHLYEIADGGRWTVTKHADGIEFSQTLNDRESGYSYVYRKSLRLIAGKSEMVLEHDLKNTGKRAIETDVYNHNFLVLDQHAPGPGLVISVPFTIRTNAPPPSDLAQVRGKTVEYLKTLKDHDTVAMPFEGFGDSATDNQVQIESSAAGAGIRFRTDRPLLRESLWSIRSVVAMEPFIAINVQSGADFHWTTVYDYYTLPHQ